MGEQGGCPHGSNPASHGSPGWPTCRSKAHQIICAYALLVPDSGRRNRPDGWLVRAMPEDSTPGTQGQVGHLARGRPLGTSPYWLCGDRRSNVLCFGRRRNGVDRRGVDLRATFVWGCLINNERLSCSEWNTRGRKCYVTFPMKCRYFFLILTTGMDFRLSHVLYGEEYRYICLPKWIFYLTSLPSAFPIE